MDNEVLKAIRERRSLRRFKGEQVGDDALKAVLETGTWAPTAFGKQDPWIVAVQNEALRARLTAMNARVMGTESDPYYGARPWCWSLPARTVPTRTATVRSYWDR